MINDIKRVRERYLNAGPTFGDQVEYSITQAIALTSGIAAVAFVAYMGVASVWAILLASGAAL